MEIINFLQLIAAAGGGGSSSGGGSGGGGDGDGGGGIIFVMYLLGMMPMSKLGKKYRNSFHQKKDDEAFKRGQIITWCVAGGLAVLALLLGLFMSWSWLLMLIIVAPFIVGLITGAGNGLYGWFDKIKPNKNVKKDLTEASASDRAWDENYLKQGVYNVYTSFQRDWSNFDLNSARNYLTPRYYDHVTLMLQAMYGMGRRNVVNIIGFNAVEIVHMSDDVDNGQDSFVAGIDATIVDQLIDMRSNQIVYQQTYDNIEEWRFQRDGNSWRLDGIIPQTADGTTAEYQIWKFAESNGAYYSLDWGRLLIPARGQLFDGGFVSGDINNHVIGRLVDTGRAVSDAIIYQIYTYSVTPANRDNKIYLIGQITVPKYYDNIIVRRRKGLFQSKVKGLQEISTEWVDFNQKFQVFATSPEQATSFELLNPQMMQWLEAVPFEANIEVVDNSIYFYAQVNELSVVDYDVMLQILQAAYRELKM